MKSYYEIRRRAIIDIDAMVTGGKDEDEIAYVIEKRYGLSQKFVKQRVDLLKRLSAKVEKEEAKTDVV